MKAWAVRFWKVLHQMYQVPHSGKGVLLLLLPLIGYLIQRQRMLTRYVRRRMAEVHWRSLFDMKSVQACILSSENLGHGRVEKRTLFVKTLEEIFRNEYIYSRVVKAAKRHMASNKYSCMLPQLSLDERWDVLNTCMNHLSAIFAPFNFFMNESRFHDNVEFGSAWYLFTLVSHLSLGFRRARSPKDADGFF